MSYICHKYIVNIDVIVVNKCYSSGFACQQRVLKTFPDHGYPSSEDEVSI